MKSESISRRQLLRSVFTACGAMSIGKLSAFAEETPQILQAADIFKRIVAKSIRYNWDDLPIGELMGKIAEELNGTPYVANTLERSTDKEFCVVDLNGLDCVTFFESTLDLARTIKKGDFKTSGLVEQVELTRYRGGVVGDFTSRLHYTTDWFVDNQKKKVVELLNTLPGAEPFTQKVSVMSEHAEVRMQLKAHPELVTKIRDQEAAINSRQLKYIPINKIAAAEHLLRTGDIVGVCTSTPGVDIVHTGIVYCDAEGVRHFMDASSKKSAMRVQIESGPLSKALSWSQSNTGAMFARPLEPR